MNEQSCTAAALATLKEIQNSDGGWGYREQTQSRVEPTCWAYRALSSAQDIVDPLTLSNARQFLIASQTKDGFWCATPEMETGNWVTSLACTVLGTAPDASHATTAGMAWLCKDYPLDSSALVRFIRRLRPQSHVSEMSDSYRGWGWTPRTSSWVEPTAFALMALDELKNTRLPAEAERRRESATNLLYDRMCPGGGWNCGNPRVYGVAGEPLVLPTSWALTALRAGPDHERKTLSLSWLEAEVPKIESPGSLAVATMCLEAYDRRVPPAKFALQDCATENLLQDGVHVLAWVCLALNPDRSWPARMGVRV